LDKDTSGLLVVARDDETYSALQEMIQARELTRQYLSLVWGHMKDSTGTIDLSIGRSQRDRKKMAVAERGGREAVSHYEVIERFRVFDLLEVTLETGRTHQIRVHLSHISHPVFGDPDYGGRHKRLRGVFGPERPLAKRLLDMIDRQALHAWKLAFVHPVTGGKLSFKSDPPEDLHEVLALLRSEGQ
jgi:23S rRNA pseudouridine1911/1915/1917 synthase